MDTKQSVPMPVIAGIVAVVLVVLGFLMYRAFASPSSSAGGASSAKSRPAAMNVPPQNRPTNREDAMKMYGVKPSGAPSGPPGPR